jgi:hypothetical protein
MSDTTNIHDLPIDPAVGGNVQIRAEEIQRSQQQQNEEVSLDQSTINQLVSGMQQAYISGVTQLPSRDIPMNTSNVSIDPQTVPNYVPQQPNHNDYIRNYETSEDIVNKYNKNRLINSTIDNVYDEIQAPLMISILYFLFQLPFFKNLIFKYLKFLFSSDGNYNFNGYLFISALFGCVFHLLMKMTSFFGKF